MRMIDVLIGMRDGQHNGCRRLSWAPHIVIMVNNDRTLWMVNTSASVRYPYDPHSIDRDASDWVPVFVYDEPSGLRIEAAEW